MQPINPQNQPQGGKLNLMAIAVIVVGACVLQLLAGRTAAYVVLGLIVAGFVAFPSVAERAGGYLMGRPGYNPIFRSANKLARVAIVVTVTHLRRRIGW